MTVYRGVKITTSWATSTCTGPGGGTPSRANSLKDCKKTTLEEVLGYQNPSVVLRIQRELGVEMPKAQEFFADLKRFLWLIANSSVECLVPSPVVDEAWHSFVLFTQEYADFCDHYFGRFIHHSPVHQGEARMTAEDLQPTIDAIHVAFGGVPSTNWHYVPVKELLAA